MQLVEPMSIISILIVRYWVQRYIFPPVRIQINGIIRSSRPEVFCKKVFLEISQNSQENTRARVSFLINLQDSGLQLY